MLFTRDSALLFFAGWITFSLIFHLRGWKGWLLGLSVVVIFFALMLSFKWTSGFSNNRIIAGLIPYKDQFFFYHGAREVLSGNLIPNHFLQATWRPLFPGVLFQSALHNRRKPEVVPGIVNSVLRHGLLYLRLGGTPRRRQLGGRVIPDIADALRELLHRYDSLRACRRHLFLPGICFAHYQQPAKRTFHHWSPVYYCSWYRYACVPARFLFFPFSRCGVDGCFEEPNATHLRSSQSAPL